MSASPRGGGLVAFRLSEVPEAVRLRAKERLLRGVDPKLPPVGGFADRIAIGIAAERPSDRVYWIPRPAYERVVKRRRGSGGARAAR